MKRSALLIVTALMAALALAPGAAQAKSKQCGTTVRSFPAGKFKFKVWVAHGNVSCTLAKKVMGRAFTDKAVKGWKCYDATKGPTPVSYSDNCKKGRSEVRGNYLGEVSSASAHAAFTGKCKSVPLNESITARVVVHNDTCALGRGLVRRWLEAGAGARRLRKIEGYVCVFGGHTVLTLRCTKGTRVMRATWGD